MKKLLLLLLLISVQTLTNGQSISPADQDQVKQLIIDSFEHIWSNLDSTKISEYHTDDYLLLEHGEVWNNDTIKNYMRRALASGSSSKRENKFEFIKIERYGNAVWVAYKNWATWTANGEVTGEAYWLESAVAIRKKEGWRIKMLHSTRVPKE